MKYLRCLMSFNVFHTGSQKMRDLNYTATLNRAIILYIASTTPNDLQLGAGVNCKTLMPVL